MQEDRKEHQEVEDRKGMQLENGGGETKAHYDDLLKLFELYTNVQVNAETIYHNRTSIITLTEGLLLLGYQTLVTSERVVWVGLVMGLSVIGCALSVLWVFFEQRNEIYFKGRGSVLKTLEDDLGAASVDERRAFRSFWTEVPRWVKTNARWYQKVSAPLVLRGIVPCLFVVTWLGLSIASPFIMRNREDGGTAGGGDGAGGSAAGRSYTSAVNRPGEIMEVADTAGSGQEAGKQGQGIRGRVPVQATGKSEQEGSGSDSTQRSVGKRD